MTDPQAPMPGVESEQAPEPEAPSPDIPPRNDEPTESERNDALRPLDPGALRANRLASFIASGVVVLALFVLLIVELVFDWWGWTPRVAVWAGSLVLALALGWLSLVWTRLSHNATVYRVNEEGLEIRRGVLWRRVISVPRSRIQHTDVGQGPLLRRYGLAEITVHTAATRTPSVALWGLEHETAMRVREDLRQTGRDDGV